MSRLPQPSSRSGAKSPFKTSASPTPSARATPTPPAKPRIRTQSAAPAPSPRPQTTLRSKPSLKSLKPPRSPTKSPARKTQPLPPDEDVPPTPPLPQLSIREQIALRRAEVKKATAKPTIVASASAVFDGLEDASPHAFNQPVVDVDLGRWSIKETIERGRSSGE